MPGRPGLSPGPAGVGAYARGAHEAARAPATPRHLLTPRLLSPARRERLWRGRLRARGRLAADLDALALIHGTDKCSAVHGYTRLYERHLGARRREIRSLLEIGVGGTSSGTGYETRAGGQSLRMWEAYLPRARIVGADLHAKDVAAGRILFEQGDQADPAFLARLRERHGPFDVVIDDGSHLGRDVAASFAGLWDAVRPGGFYVIEDLDVAYHPDWEGGPPGTPGTAAALVKTLVDETLLRYRMDFRPSLAALHLYGAIAFLERA